MGGGGGGGNSGAVVDARSNKPCLYSATGLESRFFLCFGYSVKYLLNQRS